MQGEAWIDRVMQPLSGPRGGIALTTSDYNRIWEAVARGTEPQGRALVQAIVNAINAERCDDLRR